MADLLSGLLNAVGIANTKLNKTYSKIDEILGESDQIGEQQKANNEQLSKNAVTLATENSVREKTAQQQINVDTALLGVNPTAQGEIISKVQSQLKVYGDKVLSAAAEVQADDDASLFTDPKRYLIKQFTQEANVKALETAKRNFDVVKGVSGALTQATTEAGVRANIIKSVKSDAEVAADISNAKLNIDQKNAESQLRLLGSRAQLLQNAAGLDHQQLANTNLAYNATLSDRADKRAAAQSAISIETAKTNLELTKRALEQGKLDDAGREEAYKTAVEGSRLFGQDISGQSQTTVLKNLANPNLPFGKFYTAALQRSGGGAFQLGSTPAEALISAEETNYKPSVAEVPVVNYLRDVRTSVLSNPANRGAKPAELSNLINQTLVKKANDDMAASVGLYKPPPVPSLYNTFEGLKTSPFGVNVLKPLIDNNLITDYNPEQIAQTTIKNIQAGRITFEQGVTGLKALANSAVIANNATNNFAKFGLPDQTGLRGNYSKGFSRKSIDWADEKDIKLYLMLQQSAEANTLPAANAAAGF